MSVKNNALPVISIVTTSYNQGRFLEETMLSVLNEGYPNLEYIVIDGGSTDNSVEIIRKYESRLAYWVSEKDNGPEEALDKGFARATGDIFTLVNSDDLLMRGGLHKVARTFMETGVDLVYGDGLHIDGEGRIIKCEMLPGMHPRALLLYACGCLHATSTYWTSSLHRRVGPMDLKCPQGYLTDILWFLRLTGVPGLKYRFLRVPLSIVRVYDGQRITALREEGDNPYKLMAARARADYIREHHIPRWKLLLYGMFYGAWRRIHNTYQNQLGWKYLFHIPLLNTFHRLMNVRHEWRSYRHRT